MFACLDFGERALLRFPFLLQVDAFRKNIKGASFRLIVYAVHVSPLYAKGDHNDAIEQREAANGPKPWRTPNRCSAPDQGNQTEK